MTNQIDHIVKHLFSKKNLEDVSEIELENFVDTHPYFAAGRFLLAKKMQITRSEQTDQNIATASLYYNNALWLQWLLDQDLVKKNDEEIKPAVPADNSKTANVTQNNEPLPAAHQPEVEIVEQHEENVTANEFSISQPDAPAPEQVVEEQNVPTHDREREVDSAVSFPESEVATSGIIDEGIAETTRQEPIGAYNSEQVSGTEDNQAAGDLIQADEPVKNDPELPETIDADIDTREENAPALPLKDLETQSAYSGQDVAEEAKIEASAASIGKTLATAALIPTKAEIEKNDFAFEPYHTIDYFASQGIKLQQSDLSKDKFGKQLKSFTEWLRSMKRLPQAPAEASLDEATQQSIQRVADHSIEEKEIVTETMAEVWIKQGNREKAIDTLHKLSLLNPSKSHYFAARIEQLKAS